MPENEISLEDRVQHIRSQTISTASRKIYKASFVQFLSWLHQNRQHYLTENLKQLLADTTDSIPKTIRHFLDSPEKPEPILFDELDASTFMAWLLSLRKADGSSPGYSTFNSHRAALFNLYRDYNRRMRSELSDELVTLFKGLKRDIATRLAGGQGRVKTGKDGFDFSFYQFLGKEFLSNARSDYVFAHCFMVFCWNLMCRAGNMVTVCFSHMAK
jgi:hypothetical protein